MPRSGTTWLARLLATATATGLPGREPMNPRGRQYALGGTLTGWTKLGAVTPRQHRALRMTYLGCNPIVFSRYGRRQWAAPLPWTRVVLKDPFAMLSIPVIAELTGAFTVLLYRHPAAALASYRRMGWHADLDELRPILTAHRASQGRDVAPELPRPGDVGEAEAMAAFWAALYEIALDSIAGLERHVAVVAHEELTLGGTTAASRLFDLLGLDWTAASERELGTSDRHGQRRPSDQATPALHNFDRSPADVTESWRAALDPAEIKTIEQLTATVRHRLDASRLDLARSAPGSD